jgi:hypothetical protein
MQATNGNVDQYHSKQRQSIVFWSKVYKSCDYGSMRSESDEISLVSGGALSCGRCTALGDIDGSRRTNGGRFGLAAAAVVVVVVVVDVVVAAVAVAAKE